MDTKRIIRKIGIAVILTMSLLSFLIGISTAKAAPKEKLESNPDQPIDIRFIVDASYNMKQHDPEGLRIRALQKVIKQLPSNAKSGIWTYGKYVNMLVPVSVVDNKWKKNAIYKLESLSGYGSFRNLNTALKEATYSYKEQNNYKKYIVLVTNGDLRIDNSTIKNAESQLQLLQNTLPKLKQANIELHTLSFGDKSDTRLLKILAAETNGKWYAAFKPQLASKAIEQVYKNIAKHSNELPIKHQTSMAQHKLNDEVLPLNKMAEKKIITSKTINIGADLEEDSLISHLIHDKELNKTEINSNEHGAKPNNTTEISKSNNTDGGLKVKNNKTARKEKDNKHISNTQGANEPNVVSSMEQEIDFNWPTVYSD